MENIGRGQTMCPFTFQSDHYFKVPLSYLSSFQMDVEVCWVK